MFEDEVGPSPEDVVPGVVLPVVDADGDPSGPVVTAPPSAAPTRRRIRTRVVGFAAVAVALAIGIVVPLELGSALTVSGAVGSVFAQPDVRFVVSETGTPQLQGYAVALTISNPSGGAVSAPGAHDAYEISVLHDGTDLGDVMLTHTAVYVRFGTAAIDQLLAEHGDHTSLSRRLDRIARKHADMAWLQQVAAGDWMGFQLSQLKPYLKQAAKSGSSASKVEHESSVMRSALTMSFAQAWDAWTSLHVASSSGGTTEYSLRLPVRDFLLSFARDFESHIAGTLPQVRKSFSSVNRALGSIPKSIALPIDLWIADGALTKVAVSYRGITVDVGVSHPGPLPAAPSGVTYLTVRQLKAFGRYLTGPVITGAEGGEIAAEADVQTALTGAMTYYTENDQSFSGLTSSGPNSIRSLDTGLTWLAAGQASKSARQISSLVTGDGGAVLLVADSPSAGACLGIMDVQRVSAAHPLLGVIKPGTYYFLLQKVRAAGCNAATITSVKHLSTQGFPLLVGSGNGGGLLPFGLGFGSGSASSESGGNAWISTPGVSGMSGQWGGMMGGSGVSGVSGISGMSGISSGVSGISG